MNKTFNKKECIAALLEVGFYLDQNKKRRSLHDKYIAPQEYKRVNSRVFIMIPHGSKLYCQNAIISQLKMIGGQELLDKFFELV